MTENAFLIHTPNVSDSMRLVYDKGISIIEMMPKYKHPTTTVYNDLYEYTLKRSGWEKKEKQKTITFVGNPIDDVISRVPHDDIFQQDRLLFSSFELAHTSKVLITVHFIKLYEKHIEDIKGIFNRKMPNLDKHLNIIKNEYPENLI